MGITRIEGIVSGPSGKERSVEFLIDSGATYSVLPDDVWRELGLEAKREIKLSLADGTPIERQVSECHIAIAGEEGHSPVILGEPGDAALLGSVTLAAFGLMLHPFKRALQPMRMRLGRAS
ncbi:MAG: retroviral-like aspartic protease family protein [Planctomycetota bacterium]|jgi:clan AA aspartic protease